MPKNQPLLGATQPIVDLICFSHLRWNFVYQRPQHLMSRFAQRGRVFFIEEPIIDGQGPYIELSGSRENLFVCVPHLPDDSDIDGVMIALVDQLVRENDLAN